MGQVVCGGPASFSIGGQPWSGGMAVQLAVTGPPGAPFAIAARLDSPPGTYEFPCQPQPAGWLYVVDGVLDATGSWTLTVLIGGTSIPAIWLGNTVGITPSSVQITWPVAFAHHSEGGCALAP